MGAESLNCTSIRKSAGRSNNNRTSNSSLSSDNGGTGSGSGGMKAKGTGPLPVTTRGGLRVYKVVILGDGGVGKSGKCVNEESFAIRVYEIAKRISEIRFTENQ